MMQLSPLATFTPSLVEPAILEKLFIGRERVVSDLVDRAKAAATSKSRAHRMIIGPRGAGKSHLAVIASHRIRMVEGVQVAQLSEDPWKVDTYTDLLKEVLQAIDFERTSSQNLQSKKKDFEFARELELAIARRAAEHGVIVVIAENFDQILASIGEQGQRQLRSFLENSRALLLCVTATKLGDALIKQTAPFYECFSRFELQPFSIDEASEMLARIADFRGDSTFAEYLRDPNSRWVRCRLQALDAIAGGQPRVWALLAGSLTLDGFSDLTALLLSTLDGLLPYYEQQLEQLSPRERRAVREFADAETALSVKELASRLEADDKSMGKTIIELARIGWVRKVDSPLLKLTDGRRTFYELAEPLARLALQIKDNRGTPLPMLVEFLSAWFSSSDLKNREAIGEHPMFSLSVQASTSSNARPHDLARVLGNSDTRARTSELVLERVDDALDAVSRGDAGPAFQLPSGIRKVVEDKIESDGLFATRSQVLRSSPLLRSWLPRTERFAHSSQDGIERDDALLLHATALYRSDRYYEAVNTYQQVLQSLSVRLGGSHPETLRARNQTLIASEKTVDSKVWKIDAETLLADCTRTLGPSHRETLTIRFLLSQKLMETNPGKALTLFREIRKGQEELLGGEHVDVFGTRHMEGFALRLTGRLAKAVTVLRALEVDMTRRLGCCHPETLAVRNTVAISEYDSGNKQVATELERKLLSDLENVLGPDHQNTRAARENLKLMLDPAND